MSDKPIRPCSFHVVHFNLTDWFLLFSDKPCWSKWYVIKITCEQHFSHSRKSDVSSQEKQKVELITSSICVTSKPTMSQHEQNPRTGTGKLKWNAASANVINYTCASSDMACQNVGYEDYCQGFPLAPCLTAAGVGAASRAKPKIWKWNVDRWRWCCLHLSGEHWQHCWMKMWQSFITRFY